MIRKATARLKTKTALAIPFCWKPVAVLDIFSHMAQGWAKRNKRTPLTRPLDDRDKGPGPLFSRES